MHSKRFFAKLLASGQAAPATILITLLAVVVFANPALTAEFKNDLHVHDPFLLVTLLGGHLLHWSGEHLLWDVSMFAVLGLVCERWLPRAFYLTLAISALLIPLTVMWTAPYIETYRGLSGLDTAVFSLLVSHLGMQALRSRDQGPAALWLSLLLLLWGKIAFEFYSGQVLFVQQVDFIPLPIAHATGAVVGTACALFLGNPLSHQLQCCPVDAKSG